MQGDQRSAPLIKGGQGRSDADTQSTATSWGWLAVIVLLIGVVSCAAQRLLA